MKGQGCAEDPRDVYALPEVARRLDLKVGTVRKLIYTGQLRAVKVGGAVRIRREDYEAFLEGLPPRPPGTEPREATRSSLVRRKRRV
jgi:excisionase family DNA binding protein